MSIVDIGNGDIKCIRLGVPMNTKCLSAACGFWRNGLGLGLPQLLLNVLE